MSQVSGQILQKYTPRDYLNSTETVLLDTRPHIMAVVGLGLIVWLVFGSFLFLGVASVAGSFAGVPLVLWLLLVILPFLGGVMRWRKTFYSLTNQRIIVGAGGAIGRSFHAYDLVRTTGTIDISTYRITGVDFKQGTKGRMFGFGDIVFGTNRGSIVWRGTKDPLEVRRQVEQTVASVQEARASEVTYTDEVIRKVAGIRTEQQFGLIPPTKTDISIKGIPAAQPSLPSAQPIPSSTQSRYCTKCGQQNTLEDTYCGKCGNLLKLPSQLETPLQS